MITINAMGDPCPVPVIKTKKAIQEMTLPDRIEVLVDNAIAVKNVSKMAESAGGKVSAEAVNDTEFKVIIEWIDDDEITTQGEDEESYSSVKGENSIVVISSDKMGDGDEEFGKVLLKGFVYALAELDTPPKKIIFYNRGAFLVAEGSDSVEDLRSLDARGVEILACGACLDFYNLSESLAVGSVTNMYSIVEAMQEADGIMKP